MGIGSSVKTSQEGSEEGLCSVAGDEPVESLWIMIRGCFHREGGQTLEQVTRGVLGSPSREVLKAPLGTTTFWDLLQAGAWTR